MTSMLRLWGICLRCGKREEATFYVRTQPQPDHIHLMCTPCGLPTLYVKLPLACICGTAWTDERGRHLKYDPDCPVQHFDSRIDESADAERAQTDADHMRELAEERAMVQAQMPVVNVEGEAPNG